MADTQGILPNELMVYNKHTGPLIIIEPVMYWEHDASRNWFQVPTQKYRAKSPDGEQRWIVDRTQLIVSGDEVITAVAERNKQINALELAKRKNMERMKQMGWLKRTSGVSMYGYSNVKR